MAEIVLAPLLQVIYDKLADPVLQKFADLWELDDNIKKLKRVLPMAQSLIQDAEEQQITEKSVRIWLSQLKDAACKAEDWLEELTCKHMCGRKAHTANFTKSREILDDLQEAATKGLNLHLAERNIGNKPFQKRETSSFVVGSEVCGREGDKRKIMDMLLQSTGIVGGGTSSVISIVGTPGIGKTTLAQFIYNDDEVKEQFNLRIWVFLSRNLESKRIIKKVIESSTGNKCHLTDLDSLQSEMWKLLNQRKYLIVLDDVWNEDQDDWDELRPLFECGVDGSRVLITTPSKKVAMVLGNSNTAYCLKGLSQDECWSIFRKRACFTRAEEEKYPNLQTIGRELMRKCEGVPLATKILGGLMRFKREEREWLYVLNSNLWDLEVYKNKILPALLVSYMHLPLHLKHCFVFCALFPRNFEIERKKLIQMWMARRLILPDGGSKQLEDIGDEYFEDLLWMSLFEDFKDYKGGPVRQYKINENFHNLARTIMDKEYLVVEKELAGNICEQVYHASFVSDHRSSSFQSMLHQVKHLRTLLVFSEGGALEECSDFFKIFYYLRTLNLSGCQLRLPQSIGYMPLLKYLDLSNNHFDELPSGISFLFSLQTLNLFGCYNLKYLPSLGKITGLRHLDISGCEALSRMPEGIKALIHLQTLPIFIMEKYSPEMISSSRFEFMKLAGKEMSEQKHLKFPNESIAHLGNMNLRGKLKIKHLERVPSVQEVRHMDLNNKDYLESLGLCWGNEGVDAIMNPSLEDNIARFQERKDHLPGPSKEPETAAATCDEGLAKEIFTNLQPPKNLKNLFVVGYPGVSFSLWILPCLTEVGLIGCRGCLQLPILGHLPLLRSLRMEGMDNTTHIGSEFYGEALVYFPSLQELFMKDSPSLQEWSSVNGKEMFPQLSKLVVNKCPNLASLPPFPCLKHLEMQSCRSAIFTSLEWSTLLLTLIIDSEYLFRNNQLLRHLKIKSCPKLQSLGSDFGGLTSLKSLSIKWCEELLLLPNGFSNLNALECLEISDCHSMKILPENPVGGLISLQAVSIENCSSLCSISVGLQCLISLKYLTIMYCPNLGDLPDNLEHFSSLLSLAIISCPMIECLPEGLKHAKTLQSLEIRICPGIKDLPEWFDSFASLRTLAITDCPNIQSLPVAVRRLTKLRHLSIQDCPNLQKRCQKDRGEDWWKVAHVPYKYIFAS